MVRAAAEEASHARFKTGMWVWYSAQSLERVTTTIASGCTAETGLAPEVLFFVRARVRSSSATRSWPSPAMRSELDAAQLEGVTLLPSRRSTLDETRQELVGKYSPLLRCGDGLQRMSDASSGAPSGWCRRHLTRREL